MALQRAATIHAVVLLQQLKSRTCTRTPSRAPLAEDTRSKWSLLTGRFPANKPTCLKIDLAHDPGNKIRLFQPFSYLDNLLSLDATLSSATIVQPCCIASLGILGSSLQVSTVISLYSLGRLDIRRAPIEAYSGHQRMTPI